MADNILYYGDNLDILRRYIRDESVDLIYLDPPFNSNATYNVLFAEHSGEKAAAQIKAFEDTWTWDRSAALAYQEAVEKGGRVAQALLSFHGLLGNSNMMAYLTMMAPRLVELHRVLKPTGSIYLHCDPTASHYLKVLMDAIFGPRNFKNEIVWKRTSAHNDPDRYGRNTDTILFYTKSDKKTWNTVYVAHSERYLRRFRNIDPDGRRWADFDLSGAGQGPARVFGERGLIEPPTGRHWMYDQEGIDKLLRENKIHWTSKGMPRLKKYADETPGIPAQALWDDIPAINSQAKERLGYPTQKPEALLERIIKASSNEGDTVLDPFCGCGTAVVVAQRLNRRWIGIDITHLAINLIKRRLKDTFGEAVHYQVVGEPVTLADAQALAEQDPYQFQWWALGLVGARPVEQRKGADKGIDGRLYFHDDASGKTKQIVFSVKAGHASVAHVRDLRGVVEREQAQIGVLITLQEPTQPMRAEAAAAGFYESPWGKHPRLQILTIEELLNGRKIDYPPAQGVNVTFERAPRAKKAAGKQKQLELE